MPSASALSASETVLRPTAACRQTVECLPQIPRALELSEASLGRTQGLRWTAVRAQVGVGISPFSDGVGLRSSPDLWRCDALALRDQLHAKVEASERAGLP